MGRGRAFSPIEEAILRENYDRTIAELEKLLSESGYARSRKSINRKLEKMRDEGQIGFRSKDTVKRSYRQRNRRNKVPDAAPVEDPFDPGLDWDDLVQEQK